MSNVIFIERFNLKEVCAFLQKRTASFSEQWSKVIPLFSYTPLDPLLLILGDLPFGLPSLHFYDY